MNTKQRHHVIKLMIPNTLKMVSQTFQLPKGFVLGAAAYTNGYENDTKEMLTLSLKDDSTIDIVPQVHIDNWRQKNCDYDKSFKPLNFESNNNTYSLTLVSDRIQNPGNVADTVAKTEVYVYFFYKNE